MTDFSQITPVTVEPGYSLEHALDRMKTMGVRMLLVTDEHDNINGVITSYDLQSEKPVRHARENGISYQHMNVGMVMTPITEIPAVELDYVQRSLVRHVIYTIKELDRPHMLVIETTNSGTQKIRGLFSSSQIGKILGRRIYEPLKASNSLVEIIQNIS
jgi:CBS-domain-containing membrane protein